MKHAHRWFLYCCLLILKFNLLLHLLFSQLKMSESTHSTSDATSETLDSQEPLLDDNGATATITTNPSTPRSGSSMSAAGNFYELNNQLIVRV